MQYTYVICIHMQLHILNIHILLLWWLQYTFYSHNQDAWKWCEVKKGYLVRSIIAGRSARIFYTRTLSPGLVFLTGYHIAIDGSHSYVQVRQIKCWKTPQRTIGDMPAGDRQCSPRDSTRSIFGSRSRSEKALETRLGQLHNYSSLIRLISVKCRPSNSWNFCMF